MADKKVIRLMLLGDQSMCVEHFIRPYFNIKTGQDSRFVLDICESNGIDIEVNKTKVNLNLRVATTRVGTSRHPTDKIRANDYERRMSKIDGIILYFYQNNSKTSFNVENKYLDEIKSEFPKIPYFLLSLRIDEDIDGVIKPIRETISVQDRWLKRELDVTTEDCGQIQKKIKAKDFYEVKVLKDMEYEGKNGLCYDYNLDECYNIEKPFNEIVQYILKKQQPSFIRRFLCCCCCCCRNKNRKSRRRVKKDEYLLNESA